MKRSILSAVLVLAACDGAGEKVDISVTLPAAVTESEISAFHAWVISGDDASCNLLVAGAQEPHDVGITLLGEGGARTGEALSATVTKREGIVYVMAFDFDGDPLFAGCTAVSNSSSVSVALGTLRVYDCADTNTPQGARCDDANQCTLGERCRSGICTGGSARDCSAMNGPCSNGTCDPASGCKKINTNEGQPCDDTLFCTDRGNCNSGTCVVPPHVCPSPPNQCLKDGVCDETYDRCVYLPKPRLTPCDDGDPCRTGDYCDYYGSCTGYTSIFTGVVECDGNACTQGDSCSTSGTCTPGATYAPAGTGCDDRNPCTSSGTCAGGSPSCTTGVAASGTPCWDGDYCSVGDRCTGLSSFCANGNYDPDYDNDTYYRYGCTSSFYTDCNDNDPSIRPFATERCADGKDNDCDGTVDEFGCTP